MNLTMTPQHAAGIAERLGMSPHPSDVRALKVFDVT